MIHELDIIFWYISIFKFVAMVKAIINSDWPIQFCVLDAPTFFF